MPPLETVKVSIDNGVATLSSQGGTPLIRLTEILPGTAVQAADVGTGATDSKGASLILRQGDYQGPDLGGAVVISGGSCTKEGGSGGDATVRGGDGDTGGDTLIRGGDSLGPSGGRGGDATVRGGDGWAQAAGDAILQGGQGQNGQASGKALMIGGGSNAVIELLPDGQVRIRTNAGWGDSASVLGGDGNMAAVWKNLKTALLDAGAQAAHCDPATCTPEDIANALIAAGLMAPAP